MSLLQKESINPTIVSMKYTYTVHRAYTETEKAGDKTIHLTAGEENRITETSF